MQLSQPEVETGRLIRHRPSTMEVQGRSLQVQILGKVSRRKGHQPRLGRADILPPHTPGQGTAPRRGQEMSRDAEP